MTEETEVTEVTEVFAPSNLFTDDFDIEQAVTDYQKFVGTYKQETVYYHLFNEEVFFLDMLYGIGIALDNKEFYGASGFNNFKVKMLDYLQKDAEQLKKREEEYKEAARTKVELK